MRMSEDIMGLTIAIEILDNCKSEDIDEALEVFHKIDKTLSPYRHSSEIYKLNAKKIKLDEVSPLTKKVLALCDQTKKETNGFFDIVIEGHSDPSGLLVGYSIQEAVELLHKKGYKNFYISAGNDLYVSGFKNGSKWKVELPNPSPKNLRKQGLYVTSKAVSTSGQGAKGIVVYNPLRKKIVNDVLSVTAISNSALDSDRFSTAGFAMGEKGIDFLEKKEGIEAYMVLRDGTELVTSGFNEFMV